MVSAELLCDSREMASASEPIIACGASRGFSSYGTEGVAIGGVDARADVTLASDFFSLAPGSVTLAFTGCSSHVTTFCERWI